MRNSLSRRTTSNLEDHGPAVKVTSTRRPVQIGDDKAIWDVYDTRLRSLQQTACKTMAKAWVKLVEPKKQSNHPYTGGEDKAPDWWPKSWGPTKEERVRHREPDHILKPGEPRPSTRWYVCPKY